MVAQLKGLRVLVIGYLSSGKIPGTKPIQDQQTAGLDDIFKCISPASSNVLNDFHSRLELRYTFALYVSDLVQALVDRLVVDVVTSMQQIAPVTLSGVYQAAGKLSRLL